jgi:hypothetical protein
VSVPAPAVRILEALESECDKGHYGPRYVTAHDVAWRADRSVSTATKWLSRLSVEHDLVIATWRSGKAGGWKISDKGREFLASLRGGQ